MAGEDLAAGVRARLEAVWRGEGFWVVQGWLCATNGDPLTGRSSIGLGSGSHPLTGFFPRQDLEKQGISSAAIAFMIDLPDPPGGEVETITLAVDDVPVHQLSLRDNPPRPFRPIGSLDAVDGDMAAGWVFDPALWWTPDADALTMVIGGHRLPVTLSVRRHDLPFSSARTGQPLGLHVPMQTAIAEQLGEEVLDELRAAGEVQIELISSGISIARRKATIERNVLEDHVADAVALGHGRPTAPDGFIDYYAWSEALDGWLFAGWIKREVADGLPEQAGIAVDRQPFGTATLFRYGRDDVEAIGFGLLGFVPGDIADAPPSFAKIRIDGDPPRLLQASSSLRALDERAAVDAMRQVLRNQGAMDTPLGRVLGRPIFEGVDTVNALRQPVLCEIDEFIVAPGAGAMLIGWLVDPQAVVASIRVRAGGAASAPLAERWVRVPRPDIQESHGPRLGLEQQRWGFHAFAALPIADPARAYLELQLHDGTVAFKPLPAPTRSGRAGIIRTLAELTLTADDIVHALTDVLAPPVIAINRARLAAGAAPAELVAGSPPAAPRCSIVVPLYGRLDFLKYQMALFSEHDRGVDEYIFVLDEPARRQECVALARQAYRQYGVPLRLILPSDNMGFAGASNAGLHAARAEHVCFLNSDVFPSTADWIGRLIGALADDASIGLIGARLLFEDGTLQHAGMDIRGETAFGDLIFPYHPGKGRLARSGDGVREVPLVTGALMMMRRALALDCGGFDTDYVIGDFEDADLCMQVRERGLRCAVHDGVELFHLERQSQGRSSNLWRQNLTLVNAATFAARWRHRFADRITHLEPGQIG